MPTIDFNYLPLGAAFDTIILQTDERMIGMTIQQCKYVLAIGKCGSFSEAAKQLFIAQSTLSVGVKALEKELNIQIFNRSGNGVYLTDAGAEFFRYAEQLCQDADLIEERYGKEIQQKLYIATQHYDFIADIFGQFLNENESSSYRFSIREIETYQVIRDVQTAYSDIGIIAIKDSNLEVIKRYLAGRKLKFTPFLSVSPHVFLRKGHPLWQRERLTMEELKEYPYVSYAQGEHNSAYFTEELMDASAVDKHVEISDRATLMNILMVTDSYTAGTGVMPSALNRGDIVSIPLESSSRYYIGYILNEERKVSPITQKFIGRLAETFQNT